MVNGSVLGMDPPISILRLEWDQIPAIEASQEAEKTRSDSNESMSGLGNLRGVPWSYKTCPPRHFRDVAVFIVRL